MSKRICYWQGFLVGFLSFDDYADPWKLYKTVTLKHYKSGLTRIFVKDPIIHKAK